jgi:23S rRNA pseudouridine2457 synthase
MFLCSGRKNSHSHNSLLQQMSIHRYFVIHKPPNMVSQFVSSHQVGLLGDLDFAFPEGTHAIGRLDSHSEGLLLCTTDKSITRLLFQGKEPHTRTYLVMVKGFVAPETLTQWEQGVPISAKKGGTYITQPCKASLFEMERAVEFYPNLIRLPEYGRFTWIQLSLTEGKYHQVRKMVSALGHKCIRLIRISIEDILLGTLPPGAVLEMDEEAFFTKLRLRNAK